VRQVGIDPTAHLKKTTFVMAIMELAVRAWPLGEWALLRRVMPDGGSSEPDVRRFVPDKGSSLGFDDLEFTPDLGRGNVVSSTARYPVMAAAENLVGAAQVHSAAFQQGRTNMPSVAALCRSAIESSANTIWLLSDVDREVRRARCRGFIQSERSPQKKFINLEEQTFEIRDDPAKASDLEKFERHKDDYERRENLIKDLPRKVRQKPPGTYEEVVKWSAKWIDANPPPHAEGVLPAVGMALTAQRFYSFASSFVHGYKWMSDYVLDDVESLKVIAEGFAAAMVMTECAVALFEAQAINPARAAARKKNCPEWLAATVAAWTPRYR
jgi:hypothetical protein